MSFFVLIRTFPCPFSYKLTQIANKFVNFELLFGKKSKSNPSEILLGLKVNLSPKWKIYWRNPEIDVDELSKALKGLDQSTVDNIAAYLSKRNQRKFAVYTEPLSKRDIDSCQLSFIDLARKMNDAQEINLADILEATDLVE